MSLNDRLTQQIRNSTYGIGINRRRRNTQNRIYLNLQEILENKDPERHVCSKCGTVIQMVEYSGQNYIKLSDPQDSKTSEWEVASSLSTCPSVGCKQI